MPSWKFFLYFIVFLLLMNDALARTLNTNLRFHCQSEKDFKVTIVVVETGALSHFLGNFFNKVLLTGSQVTDPESEPAPLIFINQYNLRTKNIKHRDIVIKVRHNCGRIFLPRHRQSEAEYNIRIGEKENFYCYSQQDCLISGDVYFRAYGGFELKDFVNYH